MHLAFTYKGMLSKPEILVWALNGGLWGPCLHGTCWGLERSGPDVGFEKQLQEAKASQLPLTQNTCVGRLVEDPGNFRDLQLG